MTNSTTEEPLNSDAFGSVSLAALLELVAVEEEGAKDDFFQNLTHPSTLVVMTKLERGVTVTELMVSRCMRDPTSTTGCGM